MERLTIDEIIEHCKKTTDKYESVNTLERLENADMSNSFIKNYWEHRQVGKWLEELKTYKDAEEQGLLKILPIAIGSDVYFIPSKTNYKLNVLNGYEQNNRVYHQRVANIVFDKRGWYLECDKNLEHGIDYILVDTFYEETWFTNKEEAEQALKQMGE